MNSFRDFFIKFLKIYKIFGITPYKNVNSSATLGYLELSLVVFALVLCWTGVIFNFSREFKTDGLVSVGNSIQFVSKYLTLTLILTFPLLRKNIMNSIIDSFENIDTQLRCLQVLPNYGKDIKINNISSIICLIYLLIILVYDFYMVYIINNTSDFFLYWFIVNIPLITITFAMLQACAVIYLIKERCKLVNKAIEEICISDLQPLRYNVILCTGINVQSSEIFVKISSALTELGRLSRLVEKFYGPFFFATFASSFAVICIQMFYCYVILITNTQSRGYNVWTMISSINIIVTNLIMIVSTTSLCESVTSEVSIYKVLIRELDINYTF